MGAHHQRLAHASPPVYEPAVMNPSITAVYGPAITIDLNPTVPKTVDDALSEPAVIWVAVVVCPRPLSLVLTESCELHHEGG